MPSEIKRLNVLIEEYGEDHERMYLVFKNAPMSLRDIEDTIGFLV